VMSDSLSKIKCAILGACLVVRVLKGYFGHVTLKFKGVMSC
jgi:hypothetical protein